MGFGRYLLSKKFWINFAIVVALTFVIIIVILKSLDISTRHGQAYIVPDYRGILYDSIDSYDPGHEFQYIVFDSVHQSDMPGGTILIQNPAPDELVKKGRKIYFTIVSKTEEKIKMPNLLDLSLRQAMTKLRTNGLKTGTLSYVPSFDKNAILAQLFKGDTIQSDSLVLKGSVIDLIIGSGYGSNENLIPFLIGKTPAEARKIILSSGFNQGKEFFLDSNETSEVKVYEQSPQWEDGASADVGGNISLKYRSIFNFNFDSLINVITIDTLAIDTIPTDILR